MTKLPPLPPSDHPALGKQPAKGSKADPLIADIDSAAARLRKTIEPVVEETAEVAPEPLRASFLQRLLRRQG